MLGLTLSHYRIIEKIGEGGMGVVYRARDERLDRDVALKVLPTNLLANPSAVASFRKEALALSRLNHPNIATIHDFDTENGISFLVMEYIPGVTLDQKLTADALPQKEIIRMGVQLAQGLQAAHHEGVIHRDLKPSNLRITPDTRLKILDFGLAKLAKAVGSGDSQTATFDPIAGTLPYMAPEQLQGGVADVRSDIYSAGAVLYEMVTRRKPFPEAKGAQLINAILHLDPRPPVERNLQVSPRLQTIILKSMDKDPARRYQSASELQVDLERINSDFPIVETETDPSQPVPLEIAHILFMDVIGYSLFPMDQQREILRELQSAVCSGSEFVHAKSGDQLISLPTGDGMALVFFGNPEAPCRCAIQVSSMLRNHPKIKLRMGIHTGPVYRVPDINDSRNVAGAGINTAQRVMDCGQAGHILVSKAVADVLGQITSWSGLLHDIGEITVKHGARIHLFNLYSEEAGNSDPPKNTGLKKVSRKVHSHSRTPADSGSRLRAATPPMAVKPSSMPVVLPPPSRKAKFTRPPKIAFIVSVMLVVLVAFAIPTSRQWISSLGHHKPSMPPGVPSLSDGQFLAILPFQVRGESAKLRAIAEGLDEALATKLFTLQDLSLASSQAARKVDPNQPLRTIAGSLGVNRIVKGIVEGTAAGIRITVILEDVLNNKRLLNEPFDGTAAEILAMEAQIYLRISQILNMEPSEAISSRASFRPTENSEAYDLYLNGLAAASGHPDTKNLNSAIGFYEAALKKDPRFALASARLSGAQLAMYSETKESQWIRKSMESAKHANIIDDNLPEAHIALGQTYGEMGQTEEAIAELKRAVRLSPKSDEGFRRLGNMYLTQGNKEQALRAFTNAIIIFPNYWENYNEIGAAYLQFGQNDKALEAFNRVIQLDPENFLGYMNRGDAFFQKASFHEAIVQYRKALELRNDADVYSNLGVAYFYLGRYQEAIQNGQKAVEIHPNDELVVGNLAASYFWAGDKNKAMETYDKAIRLANKDLEVNPRASSTLGDLAIYTAKKGDIHRALYNIKMARSISPSDFNLLAEEAQIRVMANQASQAVETLQLAFENGYPPEQAKLEPEFSSLQSNPQFESLVQKLSAKK